MKVFFAAMARRDLEGIEAFYRTYDPDLATIIVDRILASTRLLGDTPAAGPVSMRGVDRKWRAARTTYLLFYRVEHDHVRILRVRHEARKPLGT